MLSQNFSEFECYFATFLGRIICVCETEGQMRWAREIQEDKGLAGEIKGGSLKSSFTPKLPGTLSDPLTQGTSKSLL